MKQFYSILFSILAALSTNSESSAQSTSDLVPNVTVQTLYNPDGEAFGKPIVAAQMHGAMTKILRNQSISKYGKVRHLLGSRQNTNR
jgi:hypothetical protein